MRFLFKKKSATVTDVDNINKRIKELIIASGLSVSAFSEKIGVKASTMGNIVGERQSKPSYEILKAIFNSIESVNPDWVFNGDSEMFTDNHVDATRDVVQDSNKVIELEAQVKKLIEVIHNLSNK